MSEKQIRVNIDTKLHTETKIFAAAHQTTIRDIVINGIMQQLMKGAPYHAPGGGTNERYPTAIEA